MARLYIRKTCRNLTCFGVVLLLYWWFSFKDEENAVDYSEKETKETLLVDDFWVPERGFRKGNGLGERGEPVRLSPNEEEKRNKAYVEYGFNQFISDKISLNRTLPDTRPEE